MILVVPDIHEAPDKLSQMGPLFQKADRVIFLGDWFDSWDKGSDTQGTLDLLKQYLEDDKNDFCIGNHDCHYFFTNRGFMCSGFRPNTLNMVKEQLSTPEKRRFKLFHRVGDTVLSHAGYHPKYLGDPKSGGTYSHPSETEAEQALDMAFSGQFHRLFNAGYPVGGFGIGGPTWLRPQEWEPVGFLQIVGHTPQKEPKFDEELNAIFLDTSLRNVLWLSDEGKPVELVDLQTVL